MDIVDAFTHLIPEHLDDALFLGSNLENEGCDEFIASHNVIEDSLKNMLSDKDPMLGSASTQFCLPVLDSNEPNFQLTCPAGLDDIMDDGCAKESGHDAIDEEDLLLPSRDVKHRLGTSSVKRSKKSARLIAREPVRSLRKSTVAKRSNSEPAASPKKTLVVSAPIQGVEEKGDPCLKRSDIIEDQADDFTMKKEHHKPLRRSGRRACQTEQGVDVSQPFVKKCKTVGNKIKKETKSEGQAESELHEGSEVKSNLFGSCSLVLTSQSHSDESKSHIKAVTGTQCENDKGNVQNINLIEHEALVELMPSRSGGDEAHKIDEILKSLKESSNFELTESSNRTFVNLGEGNEELKLLSGSAAEETACNPWLEASVVSVLKNPRSIKDCKIEALDGAKYKDRNVGLPAKCLETVALPDVNNACASHKATTCDLESRSAQHCQKALPVKVGVRAKRQAKLKVQNGSNNLGITSSKGLKKAKSKVKSILIKSAVQPLQNATADVRAKCASKTRPNAIHVKIVRPVGKEVKERLKVDEPACQSNVKPGKGKKVKTSKHVQMHCSAAGDRVMAKQTPTVLKKVQQTKVQKTLTHILDKSKFHQTSPVEGRNPILHSQPEQIGHSTQRPIPKQLAAPLKTSDQVNEEGESKDPVGVEHLKEEEKLKLKKGLQPRQRRSSKSISFDEPPLFIPDNIAAVKKDGADHSSPVDKNVSLHGKLCVACKKNHVHRFMVGCGRCEDWFHGDCIGLSLHQAQQMTDHGKEYICVKCSADEEKKIESFDHVTLENQDKSDAHLENRTIDCEKSIPSKEMVSSAHSGERSKHAEEQVKHKVKMFSKDSGDSRIVSDGKDLESKKIHTTPVRKTSQTPASPRLSSEEKNDKIPKHTPIVSLLEEKSPKSGTLEKQEAKKKADKKVQVSNVHPATPPAPKPSVDQIRQSVRHTLNDILLKRLSESSSKIPEERAAKVAAKIEKELFNFYRDIDCKYKSKYRSLTFNLRDPKNNILYKRVLKGDISPDHLIRMSPEELASKELAAWRQRENRHTIEMIEKEQREVERRPITKITHKGEIEIESESSLKEAEEIETEEPAAAKPVEKIEEIPKEKEAEPESTSDTTTHHKSHLFDLNCKICTGRMAPPSEDLSPKRMKISIGVARKHMDNEAEHMEEDIASALSTASSILATDALEPEKPESPKASVSSPVRPKKSVPVEDEPTFLARLTSIWKGFVNMPSVARFGIQAYPVSGSLEYLTEDLPDSIQIGGRISPQTVWDYVEKIKASGTKETCLIRFCPVTEEDRISYTLLFAYFSSRRRYGVVANNMRQVKDMYLIPLGASEKVPRFLAPFDGPGLESRRPNLLLALIIRQRQKRLHSTSLDDESPGKTPDVTPEKRSKNEVSNEEEEEEKEEDDENDFFNSFTTVLHKSRHRSQDLDDEELESIVEPVPVAIKTEPTKPLRFLPGVLVGWENQSSALELASKPLPVDDILQCLLGDTESIFEHSEMALDEKDNLNEENMTSELTNDSVSETKAKRTESQDSNRVKKSVDSPVVSSLYATRTSKGLSLKGKPPDVSTEAYLANLSATSSHGEEMVKSKERDGKCQLNDRNHDSIRTTNSSFCNMDNYGNQTAAEATGTPRSTKFVYVKRDPRQAAGRKQSDIKTSDCNSYEESPNVTGQEPSDTSGNDLTDRENKQSPGDKSPQYTDHLNSGTSHPLSAIRGVDNINTLQKEGSKHFKGDALLHSMESGHSFGSGSPGVATHLETRNTLHNDPNSTSGGNFPPSKHPPSIFQNTKSCPSLFQIPAPQNYPPMYGFPPHMPPPLLPPPGFGFPRGPSLRFRSLDSGLQNPMLLWPPAGQLPGPPPRYFGPLPHGLQLAPGQSRYLGPPQLFPGDDRLPGRRHSDPWDRHDLFVERDFSRDSDVQRRQRFYSDSYQQRKNRQHEKEMHNEKYRDRDSERNRRRERDRSQEKERERKGREEPHKDKDRSRVSHSDRSTDSKSHKESKTDKSKPEHTHEKDKEREKSRERNREGEKDRERHHKDKDQSDRVKHKR